MNLINCRPLSIANLLLGDLFVNNIFYCLTYLNVVRLVLALCAERVGAGVVVRLEIAKTIFFFLLGIS